MKMSFEWKTPRRRQSPQAQVIAVVAALTAAGASMYSHHAVRGQRPRGGDIGSTTTLLIFASAIAIPIVIFLIVRMIQRGDHDSSSSDNMNSTADRDSVSSTDECDDNRPRALILAVFAAAIAIAIGMFAWTQKAHAQGTADRGAFVALNGADTVVVDKFVWTAVRSEAIG